MDRRHGLVIVPAAPDVHAAPTTTASDKEQRSGSRTRATDLHHIQEDTIMASKVSEFYADALKQLDGAIARVQREISDVHTVLRHAAQTNDKTSWLQARANFYTLRANLDGFLETLRAVEEIGDETLGVPGFDGGRKGTRAVDEEHE